MSEEEREKYNAKAKTDRQRFDEECRKRDAEVEAERESKRLERESTVDGKRERKVQSFAPKQRVARELTQDQVEAKKLRDQVRQQERDERNDLKREQQSQKDELAKKKAEAASARLNYLLSQSDIFEHFGQALKKQKKEITSDVNSPRKRLSEHEEDESMMHERHDTVRLTKQPACIEFGTMRPYQLEGLNWMINLSHRGINGILADEMGLGKTLQTISMLGYTKESLGVSGPHIVLVPKSTLSNWLAEFERWCPSLRAVKFHGNKDERQETINEILRPGLPDSQRKFDVCVTTFEMCIREKSALTKFAWRYLVIDEAHRIKNEASQFSQVVRTLETEHRLLLTGTPLQNNLHELWALLNFLLPDIFSSSEQFDEWFNLDVDDDESKKKMITQLHRILRPFMLRRLKADVEKSLLPKKETLLFVGMSAMQKQLYKSLLLRDMDAVTGTSSSRTALLNIVMQLRKCCGHPYLFEGQEDRTLDAMGEHLIENCGKLVLVDKLLRKLKERGSRVLIFSQMTRVLDILEDFCRMRGYGYCRIDGQTSYMDREDSIDAYNQPNSSKFAFLLSTRAGGLGINLYTADTVILYDSDWNPQADLQAQDRAHRIGQKKQVNVYRLVTSNSVEEKIVERAQQKLKLDAMVVQQGRLQEKNSKLSKSEMLEMIRFGADQVFRATESCNITDDDIDAILAQGEARTEEMNKKLTAHDKGDLLDFKLDGGGNVQQHDGVDYSNEKSRQDELKRMAEAEFALAMAAGMGKRERKPVANYSDRPLVLNANKKQRTKQLPKALRLPRMDDWHFYDRKRLIEIHEIECGNYELSKTQETPMTEYLPAELQEEKQELLAHAFSDWNKQTFCSFTKLLARYGRENLKLIARELGRDEDSVRQYAAVFWERGPDCISDWDRILKNIEKGESKLLEIQRLNEETKKKVERYENPWETMKFTYQGKQGKVYTEDEDRYLLCLAYRHGYGAWEKVKRDICASDRFLFDYYFRSRTAIELGRRCDTLMRICEKDNRDFEAKDQKYKALRDKLTSERLALDRELHGLKSEVEQNQSVVDKQILSEAKKMNEARKTKREWMDRLNAEKDNPEMYTDEAISCYLGPLLRFLSTCAIRESNLAALAFCQNYPDLPVAGVQRQIKQVADLMVKRSVKKTEPQWRIRQEYESKLNDVGQVPSPTRKRKASKSPRASTPSPSASSESGSSAFKKPRLPKSPWSPSATKQPTVSKPKKKPAPRKPRSAYVLFSLSKRPQVKKSLPSDATVSQVMTRLNELWQALSTEEQQIWMDKEEQDKVRYQRDMKAHEEALAVAALTAKTSADVVAISSNSTTVTVTPIMIPTNTDYNT